MIAMDSFGDEIDPDLARAMAELEAAAVARGLVRDEKDKRDKRDKRDAGPVSVSPLKARDWLSRWEADHER